MWPKNLWRKTPCQTCVTKKFVTKNTVSNLCDQKICDHLSGYLLAMPAIFILRGILQCSRLPITDHTIFKSAVVNRMTLFQFNICLNRISLTELCSILFSAFTLLSTRIGEKKKVYNLTTVQQRLFSWFIFSAIIFLKLRTLFSIQHQNS